MLFFRSIILLIVIFSASARAEILLSKVFFDGSKSIDENVLQQQIAGFFGEPVSNELLDNLRSSIFDRYALDGMFIRTSLPAQDLSDGTLVIQIIEFPLGSIKVEAPQDLRFPISRAERYITSKIDPEKTVKVSELDQQVALLDELPGIAAEVNILDFEGDKANVSLELENTGLFESSVQADNLGSQSTGRARLSVDTQINSLLHQGERIALGVVKTESLETLTTDINLPVGYSGISYSVGGELTRYSISSVNLDGESPKYWIRGSFPEITLPLAPVKFDFGVERSLSRDDLTSNATKTPLTRKKVDKAYAAVKSSVTNEAGNAAFDLSLRPTVGRLDLSELSQALTTDQQTLKTQGAFTKLLVDATYQRKFSPDLSGSLLGTCQFANKNLDSSEEIEISGPSAVRAYDVGAVSGDQGCHAQAEMIYQLTATTAIFGFYDAGVMRTHVTPYAGWNTNNEKNRFSIQGAGAGVRANFTDAATLAVTAARRIGNCDGCANSQALSRLWAVLTVSF